MPSFQLSIAGALLLFTCMFAGCHTQTSSLASNAQQGLRCDLNNRTIAFASSRLDIPEDQALTSVGPLVSSLATQSSGKPLLIAAAPETTANTLLRVLLSAQEAQLDEAYLSVSNQWLELALPDSSTIPPMSVADIYFSLGSGTITASRDLAALGNPSPRQTPLENQRSEIERLVKSNCGREAPCTHAVLSIGSAVSFKEMSDLMIVLTEFREGAGSLRLVINGDAPTDLKRAPRNDARLTRAMIRETIAASNEEFRVCRGKSFENTAAGGTITIEFTVTGLGLVFDAEVISEESTIQDAIVQNCIREAFLKMKFAKPEAPSLTVRHIVRL